MVHVEIRHVDQAAIAVLRIDNPPVNSVGSQVRVTLGEQLDKALADAQVKAVVLTGSGRFFSGGADIREFNTPKTQVRPLLRELIARIEGSGKPVVAAINGTALGGGLELTLGCHGRVASETAKLGLPEVKLGVLPGAGGTQRLPRLIGIADALDMIVGGEPITAHQALANGLVDEVAADPIDAACRLGLALSRGERESRAVDPGPLRNAASEALFEAARRDAQRRYRGCNAPLECIGCIEQTVHTSLETGLAHEADRFKFLVEGDQSKAQRHLFFAERQATKLPSAAEPSQIARVGVVGAGTMGGGIAMSLANGGYWVVLLEQTEAALQRGWNTIQGNYAASSKRGRFTEQEVKDRLSRIQCSLEYGDLADVDLVIEAAFEDMQVKKEIFTRLDAVCKPTAILASNTSRLDINEIAAVTSRPAQVLGMHFFSPANVMRLLEVVKGAKTSDSVIATVFRLAVRLNKIPVLVGVCDGFVGNRMVSHYTREAYFLLEEGCTPAQVDGALRRFGMAMGPLQMQDMAGLDISWAARKRQAPTRLAHLRYSKVADRICEMGRFGQKTGSGFYRYEAGSREPIPDPQIDALIAQCSAEAGITRREISDEEIIARTIYALVNEGARILQDGIAQRASDIDVVYVAGYGFPMFRGGPMFYADTVGLPEVLATIRRFHEQHGEYWEPAPLLVQLAESGRRFSDS
ncbi:3-hydroxyacyl-CoA dehydrogenase NAD-binding domain-containing protein [Bordetella sp. 15P40C-2]|uniref:3-hydroxyacyl-CoA dehydrogenase NAD-binding domain-containing protein n=1 Tax=Bordetella sp. 15P40C-2 TaxID=2572246 RepID=UPI0013244B30|nr:3-hydroxyacyl-CoA dehydrogenase NAD-binding domain-containing protein [Bordetella sp. 15P40C-2]MVW71192.1 3-hydroxyacyl-CoA dehydrogenase [Bordetella sp. 15P40C-2]